MDTFVVFLWHLVCLGYSQAINTSKGKNKSEHTELNRFQLKNFAYGTGTEKHVGSLDNEYLRDKNNKLN